MNANVLPNLALFDFKHFDLRTLVIESKALKDNPLGDSSIRRCPVLVPREGSKWPVVLMLSGFTGNGTHAFNAKSFEISGNVKLDHAVGKGEAPRAVYVFLDAMTMWGGSQFINSPGMGEYEDFLLEVASAVRATFDVSREAQQWCVMGGSSGGYGALHLASKHPSVFGVSVALAPDSFFEASLLGEIRTALPFIKRMGGVNGVRAELLDGRLMKRKDGHTILNAVAMGLCYAGSRSGEVQWPIDAENGLIKEKIWAEWKKHDPLYFLAERETSSVHYYLDAGDRDQFQLQYGTRQIRDLLVGQRADATYVGFDGTHFDLAERRLPAWQWLAGLWRV